MSEALGPEFEVIEQLHIGKHSKVVRCKYKNTSVIVKTHPHPFARRNELEGLQKEYELVQLISSNSAHIVKFNSFVVKEFEDKKVAAAIIMDDCGGRSLSHVLPANGFAVPKFLEIAIQCVQGLQVIHRNNIIHKDLKPANMVTFSLCTSNNIAIEREWRGRTDRFRMRNTTT
jgi:serine/threonine protein kinase